jgi:hypothetical protein
MDLITLFGSIYEGIQSIGKHRLNPRPDPNAVLGRWSNNSPSKPSRPTRCKPSYGRLVWMVGPVINATPPAEGRAGFWGPHIRDEQISSVIDDLQSEQP